MKHDFCKNCQAYLAETDACYTYVNCNKWRRWFAREWQRVTRVLRKGVQDRDHNYKNQRH